MVLIGSSGIQHPGEPKLFSKEVESIHRLRENENWEHIENWSLAVQPAHFVYDFFFQLLVLYYVSPQPAFLQSHEVLFWKPAASACSPWRSWPHCSEAPSICGSHTPLFLALPSSPMHWCVHFLFLAHTWGERREESCTHFLPWETEVGQAQDL